MVTTVWWVRLLYKVHEVKDKKGLESSYPGQVQAHRPRFDYTLRQGTSLRLFLDLSEKHTLSQAIQRRGLGTSENLSLPLDGFSLKFELERNGGTCI